ncbi:MAG: hypothetical protein IH987_20590 [Planctomycetes bacterium]|nr:hypothetical protein [Planctomycetota bacterium]
MRSILAVRLAQKGSELSVRDLCNRFLTAKTQQVESGEIAAITFNEYKQTTDLIVGAFASDRPVDDLASDDFESLRGTMTERWGPVRLSNAIVRVKGSSNTGSWRSYVRHDLRARSNSCAPSKTCVSAAQVETLVAALRCWVVDFHTGLLRDCQNPILVRGCF